MTLTPSVGSEEDSEPGIDGKPRWSIWIDIEGFSKTWDSGLALQGLRALMSGIYAIGTKVFTGDGDRLFAHQFGDGFVIVADFHEPQLDRCAAVATVLMRHILTSGCVARAAISEGEFADYAGCWPREIREQKAKNGGGDCITLGSGLMTLLPVMGTALINANKLDSGNRVKGGVLTIRTNDAPRFSAGFVRQVSKLDPAISMIDWIHATSPIIDTIVAATGLASLSPADSEAVVERYISGKTAPPLAWIQGTTSYASLSTSTTAHAAHRDGLAVGGEGGATG